MLGHSVLSRSVAYWSVRILVGSLFVFGSVGSVFADTDSDMDCVDVGGTLYCVSTSCVSSTHSATVSNTFISAPGVSCSATYPSGSYAPIPPGSYTNTATCSGYGETVTASVSCFVEPGPMEAHVIGPGSVDYNTLFYTPFSYEGGYQEGRTGGLDEHWPFWFYMGNNPLIAEWSGITPSPPYYGYATFERLPQGCLSKSSCEFKSTYPSDCPAAVPYTQDCSTDMFGQEKCWSYEHSIYKSVGSCSISCGATYSVEGRTRQVLEGGVLGFDADDELSVTVSCTAPPPAPPPPPPPPPPAPATQPLTVVADTTFNTGVIVSTPPGIGCGTGMSVCSTPFVEGTSVELRETAGKTVLWNSDCTGNLERESQTVTIVLDTPKTCTATVIGNPTIEVTPNTLFPGERTELVWTTGGSSSCTITANKGGVVVRGTDVNTSELPVTGPGSDEVTINETTTFTIDCGGGLTDQVTVYTVVIFEET